MPAVGIVSADRVLGQVEDLIGEIAPLTSISSVLSKTAEFLSQIDGVVHTATLTLLGDDNSIWVSTLNVPPFRLDHGGDKTPPHIAASTGTRLVYDFASPPPAPNGVDPEEWAQMNAKRAEAGDVDVIAIPLRGTTEWIGSLCIVGDRPEGLDPALIESLEVLGSVVAMTLEKVTMVDQAAAQLKEINNVHHRLEKSNRDFQSFAQMASSDLQDPLRKIIAFGDRLERSAVDELTERELDYLARIHSASDRMQRLINDLLTFANVHSTESNDEPVDLELVVADVLSDLEVAIAESGAIVKIGALPTLLGNSTQLRQLFQNLIGNAIKFRAEGVAPRIDVGLAESTGPFWVVEVADNGIGFDAKFLQKIFRPFQRLHGTSEYQGSGIGLSVCKRIVNRHGGFLTARSSVGEGATFVLNFPKHVTKSVSEVRS